MTGAVCVLSEGHQKLYVLNVLFHCQRSDKPGVIVYEAQANPADHVKLPGMGVGMHSSLGSG